MEVDIRGCITECEQNSWALFTLYGLGLFSTINETFIDSDVDWLTKLRSNNVHLEHLDEKLKKNAILNNDKQEYKLFRLRMPHDIIRVYYGNLHKQEEFWKGVHDGFMKINTDELKYFFISKTSNVLMTVG